MGIGTSDGKYYPNEMEMVLDELKTPVIDPVTQEDVSHLPRIRVNAQEPLRLEEYDVKDDLDYVDTQSERFDDSPTNAAEMREGPTLYDKLKIEEREQEKNVNKPSLRFEDETKALVEPIQYKTQLSKEEEEKEETRLREEFSHSFVGQGYPANIGRSKLPLDREFEIFREERERSMRGENPWYMSPNQLKEYREKNKPRSEIGGQQYAAEIRKDQLPPRGEGGGGISREQEIRNLDTRIRQRQYDMGLDRKRGIDTKSDDYNGIRGEIMDLRKQKKALEDLGPQTMDDSSPDPIKAGQQYAQAEFGEAGYETLKKSLELKELLPASPHELAALRTVNSVIRGEKPERDLPLAKIFTHLGEGIKELVTLPGKVATGEIDMQTPEGMDRAIRWAASVAVMSVFGSPNRIPIREADKTLRTIAESKPWRDAAEGRGLADSWYTGDVAIMPSARLTEAEMAEAARWVRYENSRFRATEVANDLSPQSSQVINQYIREVERILGDMPTATMDRAARSYEGLAPRGWRSVDTSTGGGMAGRIANLERNLEPGSSSNYSSWLARSRQSDLEAWATDEGVKVVNFQNKAGQKGIVVAEQVGDTIKVHSINGPRGTVFDFTMLHTLGISGTRKLLTELRTQFPEARYISGFRVTGANPDVTKKMALPGTGARSPIIPTPRRGTGRGSTEEEMMLRRETEQLSAWERGID